MSIRKKVITIPYVFSNKSPNFYYRGTYKIPLYMKKIKSVYLYSRDILEYGVGKPINVNYTNYHYQLRLSVDNYRQSPVNLMFRSYMQEHDDFNRLDAVINTPVQPGQYLHFAINRLATDPNIGSNTKLILVYEYENPNKKK